MEPIALPLDWIAAIVGALATTSYLNLLWEIRKLRRETHGNVTDIRVISMMLSLVCQKLNLPWAHREPQKDD